MRKQLELGPEYEAARENLNVVEDFVLAIETIDECIPSFSQAPEILRAWDAVRDGIAQTVRDRAADALAALAKSIEVQHAE